MAIHHTEGERLVSGREPIEEAQALRSMLRADLVAAMKARQPEVVAALRIALAAIDNAEAVEVPESTGAVASGRIAGARSGVGSTEARRRDLSVGDVRAILKGQIEDRLAAAELYDTNGQHDAADRLRREAEALGTYLAT